MSSFCVEEQKGLTYHLEGLHVPLVVRVPQFGNHCATGMLARDHWQQNQMEKLL